MSDPAIAAAERAWDKNKVRSFHVQRVNAAREALAPLRKRHRKVHSDDEDGYSFCGYCDYSWPCPDARDIYPESEL